MSRMGEPIEAESRWLVTEGWGIAKNVCGLVTATGYGVSFWGDDILKFDCGAADYTSLAIY